MTTAISTTEQDQLTEHEAVIERGLATFVEVGTALTAIHDQQLYRASHATFQDYCRERWSLSRPRAYELMAAAEVMSAIPDTLPAPENAGQAVALARVPEAERVEVWAAVLDETDGKPTAAAVRDAYAATQPVPEPVDEFSGDEWAEPDEDAHPGQVHVLDHTDLETVTPSVEVRTPEPEPAKAKRRPLPEAFTEASHDLAKAAERLGRLAQDDRFTRNREMTHHQMPDLITALEHVAELVQALRLDDTTASEEARRWWATSLNTISDTLTGVAQSINKEQ
jgi:hypothetical protein